MRSIQLLKTHPVYRRYWLSILLSNLGNMMEGAAMSWLALQLSGSAEALGTVVALQFLPSLLLALPAGTLADSLPRNRIVQTTQMLMLTMSLVVSALVWTHRIVHWHLLVLSFIQGCLMAIDLPARQALMVELVSKENYPQAMPLNSFAFNLSRLLGPALAGVCISTLGMSWTFWINALTFLPFLLVVIRLPLSQTAVKKGQAMLGGLKYVLETAQVRQLLLMLGWISLFGVNFSTLIPAYAKLILHLEVKGYGLLMSCLGLGALGGSLWQMMTAKLKPERLLVGISGLALLHLSLFLPLPAWAVGLLWAGCGFSMVTVLINTNTLLQTMIPDELRGRIMAIYSMLLLGTTPVGAWLTGLLFDYAGGRVACAVLGLLTGLGLLFGIKVALPQPELQEGSRV